jgi:death-on-curing protein
MRLRAITLEQVLVLHAYVLADTSGGEGLRDIGRLEAALASQSQVVFGAELYPTLSQKAAAMIRGIISDHPFVDANKRTAMLTGLTYLKLNGLELRLTNQELEDFAVRVAVEHLSVSDISNWLEAHTKNV